MSVVSGGIPLYFKHNNRLFYLCFYLIFVPYIVFWLSDGETFPIHDHGLALLADLLLSYVVALLMKFLVERFIQKRKDSVFLQK